MHKLATIIACAAALLVSACQRTDTNPAATRQANATRDLANEADRQIGMPRLTGFTQRKMLKKAYEDMDRTVLTWAYVQDLSGKFVCIGQAVGYGVGLGTQFTAPTYPQRIRVVDPNFADDVNIYEQSQPEPNGLYMPDSTPASSLNLVDPNTGEARTAIFEQNIATVPFQLPAQAVSVPCPAAVDPSRVRDVASADQVNAPAQGTGTVPAAR